MPQPDRRAFIQGGLLLLAACTTGVSCGQEPPLPPLPEPLTGNGFAVYQDLAYAEPVGRAHLLDVYLPLDATDPVPVVIHQVGSAFRLDDTKGDALEVLATADTAGAAEQPPTMIAPPQLAARWVPEGYAVVGLNVRNSTQMKFPGQVHDVKAAIRFLRAHAEQLNIDPDRIATMGNSSGAWVATMAAVTSGRDEFEGSLGNLEQSSAVQAVVDLYGPTDFLRMQAHALPGGGDHDAPDSPESELMGFPIQSNAAAVQRANPAAYVTADSPPAFIAHGTIDEYVPFNQSEILFQSYQRAGGTASLTLVPHTGHTDAYLADPSLSAGRTVSLTHDGDTTTAAEPAPTFETVLAFLNTHLHG